MSSEPPVDAAGIARRTFPTGRRGYDTRQVAAYLEELAQLVEDLTRREAEARARAEAAEARAIDLASMDRDRLVALVGAETARALDDARAAASDIRTKAQEAAAGLVAAGRDEAEALAAAAEVAAAERKVELLAEAEALRAEAAGELERRRAEATEAADRIRQEAEAERARLVAAGEEARDLGVGDASEARAKAADEAEGARAAAAADAQATRAQAEAEVDELRAQARRDADAVRKQAAHGARTSRQKAYAAAEAARTAGREEADLFLAEARAEAQHLVAEALAVREKVLGDLARRRHVARQHVERLNAARERLLSAYATVRRTVDEATRELSVALPAARAASEHAARRVLEQPEPTVEQVETEISAARMAGLVDERTGASLGEVDVSALAERLGVDPTSHLPQALAESVTLATPLPPPADDLVDTSAREVPRAPTEVDAWPDAPVPVTPTRTSAPPAPAEPPADPVAELAAEAEAVAEVVAELDRDAGTTVPPVPEPPAAAVLAEPEGATAADPVAELAAEAEAVAEMVAELDRAAAVDSVDEVDEEEPARPAPGSDTVRAREPVEPTPTADIEGEPVEPAQGGVSAVEPLHPAEVPADEPADVPADEPAAAVEIADEPAASTEEPVGEEPAAAVVPAAGEVFALEPELDAGPEVEPIEIEVVESPSVVEVVANARSRLDDLFARVREGVAPGANGVNGAATPAATGPNRRRSGADDDHVTVPADHHRTSWPTPGERAAARVSAARGPGNPDDADDADLLEQRDTALAEVERTLSRRLKRVLADEENEVLDRLRRGVPQDPAEVVPERSEHAGRYARAAVAQLEEAAHRGALLVLGPDAATAGKQGRRRHDNARSLADDLGDSLVEPLRQRVARSLGEGGDVDEVLARFRALYREWKGQRVRLGVRHYAAAAYGAGALDALAAGTELRWLVDRTGEPCPDADDNALAEGVRKGQAFPTGDRCAPAHPGCRCLVVPAAGVASP